MEFIKVLKPGLLTTIQDLGRLAYQKYGIPTSGAMDPLSLRIANILVGNKEDAGAIEVTLIGPKLKFIESGVIAITGANLSPTINNKPIPLWSTIKVDKNDILKFGESINGCRSYIAVNGGIDVPEIMGSKSTFIRGGYGGLKGRRIQKGDVVVREAKNNKPEVLCHRKLSPKVTPNFEKNKRVRVILGPQVDSFTKEAINNLLSGSYTIMKDSDRMGYRLEGPSLEHVSGADIISDYITAGSIQVPGNKQPIILMADCQVTGGYTKIGTVIGVDIPLIAQKKPGEQISFEKIEINEAQSLWKKQEKLISIIKLNNI